MEELSTLVARAQAADLEAYGAVVRRFQDMAYGFAYSVLGDFHLAQDAAQEAFIEAYRDLAKLREPAAFPGWFRRIVFKHCNRLTRRRRVATVPLEAAAGVTSGEPGPAELAEKRELADKVLAAVRALPGPQRTVTTLFYINGYSQEDIAEFLDVPVTTVKKRLASSRGRLRQRVMTMVDETLKEHRLPDRFGDVVVQMNFVTERINPLAETVRSLGDAELRAKTPELRRRLAAGKDRDAVKAEAFALVREASRRAHNQPHYDVQLVAALILDQGWIAEEATGEGKTITGYPAAYMAVLDGLRVHAMTVNSYLAARDAELARAVFARLGVTVGHIGSDLRPDERRRAYQCDIVYGVNCEFGFDLLRDRLRPPDQEPIQGPLDFAIIDEADSLLIDEARTPLIISVVKQVDRGQYEKADTAARQLIGRASAGTELFERVPNHPHLLRLTAEGLAGAGALQDAPSAAWRDLVEQALRARLFHQKDREYVVQAGRVAILDEATGRPTPGRQWSDGLHQAIECKEGLPISPATQVLASVTFQEYSALHRKLAGMTGTAKCQASLFRDVYRLEVAAVPTRRPVNRVDYVDRICADADAKHVAIAEEARHYSRDLGRPVLIGTGSIEQSKRISELLRQQGIEPEVLNACAENAAREAEIVAAAGQRRPLKPGLEPSVGAVTVATNMAGRGTDIRLGPGVVYPPCQAPAAAELAGVGIEPHALFPPGTTKCCIHCPEYDASTRCAHCFKPKVDPAFPRRGRTAFRKEPPCGLHVVGAERQESRRLDDQLRARAGSQGEPGSSRFFLSLDDAVMKLLPDRLRRRVRRIPAGECVEHKAASRAIERAQNHTEKRTYARILRILA